MENNGFEICENLQFCTFFLFLCLTLKCRYCAKRHQNIKIIFIEKKQVSKLSKSVGFSKIGRELAIWYLLEVGANLPKKLNLANFPLGKTKKIVLNFKLLQLCQKWPKRFNFFAVRKYRF